MQRCEASAGDVIFREGEKADFACIIHSGRIQILKSTAQGEVELAVLGAGDVLGEMALFERRETRSATARALDDVVVDVLSGDEMRELLDQVPPLVKPIINALISRLNSMNRRLAEKERVTVILGKMINNLQIHGHNKLHGVFEPCDVYVSSLPFSIGGYEAHLGRSPKDVRLAIPCDATPLNISYEHCGIEEHEDGIYVVDYGSRFKTIVNDHPIGRGEACTKALLLIGENHVILGDPEQGHHLVIHCS
ncbi:MAG: FHA domain-containing protein [Alphaproteobacteria bacterium]|nr:MAG: FHA domain-containing protein [Alphaproteobacteria bacterium]